MTFAEILDEALVDAMRHEDYMAAAIIERDGRLLDASWDKAGHNAKRRYRAYIDGAYMRLLDQETTTKRLCEGRG